jgi:hypothetical protein
MTLPSCPQCNSANTCSISYGYPGDEEEYLQLVAEKKIFPGGCLIDDNSPVWYCNDCGHKWGRLDNPDNIDSFDYDQGFNINEVYDQ